MCGIVCCAMQLCVVWRVNPKWRNLKICENNPWVIQMVRHGRHVMLLGFSIDKFDGADVGDVEKGTVYDVYVIFPFSEGSIDLRQHSWLRFG